MLYYTYKVTLLHPGDLVLLCCCSHLMGCNVCVQVLNNHDHDDHHVDCCFFLRSSHNSPMLIKNQKTHKHKNTKHKNTKINTQKQKNTLTQ